jgi:hypothetical protein
MQQFIPLAPSSSRYFVLLSTTKTYLSSRKVTDSVVVLSNFNQIWSFLTDFVKVSNIKFHENPSSGSRVDTRRQADRRTDVRTERCDEGNRRFLQVTGTRLKRYITSGAQYTEEKWKKKGGIEFSVGGAHYNARSLMKSSWKISRIVLRLDMWW